MLIGRIAGCIEALTPGARRADIFARQRRAGWGNELGKFWGAA